MKSYCTAALRRKAGTTMSKIFVVGMWMVADGQMWDTTIVSYWTGRLKRGAQLRAKVLTVKATTKIRLASATLAAAIKA